MEKNIAIYRVSKLIDIIYNIDINISKKSTIYIRVGKQAGRAGLDWVNNGLGKIGLGQNWPDFFESKF